MKLIRTQLPIALPSPPLAENRLLAAGYFLTNAIESHACRCRRGARIGVVCLYIGILKVSSLVQRYVTLFGNFSIPKK